MGTISACYVKPVGQSVSSTPRLERPRKKGESPLTWNQAGQPGTDGVSGYEQEITGRTLPLDGAFFVVVDAIARRAR